LLSTALLGAEAAAGRLILLVAEVLRVAMSLLPGARLRAARPPSVVMLSHLTVLCCVG
jgi:hypothetical protein